MTATHMLYRMELVERQEMQRHALIPDGTGSRPVSLKDVRGQQDHARTRSWWATFGRSCSVRRFLGKAIDRSGLWLRHSGMRTSRDCGMTTAVNICCSLSRGSRLFGHREFAGVCAGIGG
jgi:hypothetical protein